MLTPLQLWNGIEVAVSLNKNRRQIMRDLNRLGIGGIIFLIGAVIYAVNLIIVLSGRGRAIQVDGVGLMVLGIGLALLLNL